MKKQFLSFCNAFSGIWNTIKSEAHMRFHLTAAFYVILFSFFYDFSCAQQAVLILLIALVISLEIINTCIEKLSDFVTKSYEPLIKFAKDAAAGAVLVTAVAAAVIAVMFFWNIEKIVSIFGFFASNPIFAVLLLLSALLSVVFVWKGPDGIRNAIAKHKK